MRKRLGKAVREEFERQLRDALPVFERSAHKPWLRGDRLYECKMENGLSLFVQLRRSNYAWKDAFTLCVGWGEDGKFPGGESVPDGVPQDGTLMFQLPSLWTTSGMIPWWQLNTDGPIDSDWDPTGPLIGESEEELLPKVAPAVSDAIERFREHGLPYFRSIAAQRGVTTPF